MLRYVHFKEHPINTLGRDFVLGDLHGCIDLLGDALSRVNFSFQADRLFCVGDLVDRGPSSLACLRLLDEPWFYSVQGNHENMMLAAINAGAKSPAWEGWIKNGGDWYLELSKADKSEVASYLPKIAKLPIACTIDTSSGHTVGVCHAETPTHDWHTMRSGEKLNADQIWRALWGRRIIREQQKFIVRGIDATFHGHTIVHDWRQQGNMFFIDTGAYVQQKLTLLEITQDLIRRD
ncbi:metallophosphoesterase [Aurantivibrio plasticivorans]